MMDFTYLVLSRHAVPPSLLQLGTHLVLRPLSRRGRGRYGILVHWRRASTGLHGGKHVGLALRASRHALDQSLNRRIEEYRTTVDRFLFRAEMTYVRRRERVVVFFQEYKREIRGGDGIIHRGRG